MSKMVQPVDVGMPTRAAEPLLEIRDLRVDFPEVGDGPAIDGMDLTINRGEIVALVGESGSGKSLTALTMMGLLPPGAQVSGGTALLEGEDVLGMSPKRLNALRGSKIAMLFQQPKVMLDPTARVGSQVAESLRRHRKVGRREAKARVVEMLRDVGIPEPARRASSFAYQLSGGMAQRVMIAAALSADPELLIADEPTTALDVTVQAQILDLLKHKRDELGLSILLITHDLGIVSTMADRVAVMYAGRIVENGTTTRHLQRPAAPLHPGAAQGLAARGRTRPAVLDPRAAWPRPGHGARLPVPAPVSEGRRAGSSEQCRGAEPSCTPAASTTTTADAMRHPSTRRHDEHPSIQSGRSR